MTQLLRTISLASLTLWLAPAAANAADVVDQLKQVDLKQYSPFLPGTSIKTLILHDIPNFLIAFVGLVFAVYFLINAFHYLLSAGNTEGTTAAKGGMLSAIIGLIVVIVAYGAVAVARGWIGQ